MSGPLAPDFRRAMAHWATGVTVVTAHDGAIDAGLTVNAFLSVSLRPPSVLVSLQDDVDTLPVVERARAFAVNILAADQRAVSDRFARAVPSAEKFRDLPLRRGASGVPLLEGTLGAFECRVVSIAPAFDHRLVVGEVTEIHLGRDAPPLVFFRSGYGVAEAGDRIQLPPRPPAPSGAR
ncbi:MAG TPA: flavin reductase family protein [Thermoplasmata archaeon]|nr:flavin reductase family protein [Thermoplasmata archaeon]